MKKMMFIYNPSSGETNIIDYLDRIIEFYQRAGFSMTLFRLTFDGAAEEVIGEIDATFDHLLIAGGDGTLNYVINIVKAKEVDIPVAILATGTANDFASMLGMPTDIMKACAAIVKGDRKRVDLGRVNGHYFVNVFSCGLFTDVSQKTPTFLKNNFGKMAYYVNGIGELPRFRKMDLKINTDGGDFDGKALIFFVFNGRTAGNLPIAYLSEVDDGLLDVLIVKGDTPLTTLRTAMKYLIRLRKRKLYPEGVVHIRCSALKASSTRDENTDMDGQPGPSFPLEIICEKNALEVIVPRI